MRRLEDGSDVLSGLAADCDQLSVGKCSGGELQLVTGRIALTSSKPLKNKVFGTVYRDHRRLLFEGPVEHDLLERCTQLAASCTHLGDVAKVGYRQPLKW